MHAIRPAGQTAEPLEGCKLESDFGFMRTPEGFLLVRLADVLRWYAAALSVGAGGTVMRKTFNPRR